jgi:hypothetical protein
MTGYQRFSCGMVPMTRRRLACARSMMGAAGLDQNGELERAEEVARSRLSLYDSGGRGDRRRRHVGAGDVAGLIHGDGRTRTRGGRIDDLVQDHAEGLARADGGGQIQGRE